MLKKDLLEAISTLQDQIRDGQSTEQVQKDLQARQEELDKFYLKVRTEHKGFAELRYPQPAGLAAVKNTLRPEELLLKYQLGEKSSYLWLVDSRQIRCQTFQGATNCSPSCRRSFRNS